MDQTPLDTLLEAHGKAAQALYTLEDSADILGCTMEALRLRIKRGTLEAVRRSPRRFAGIAHEELGRFLDTANKGGKA